MGNLFLLVSWLFFLVFWLAGATLGGGAEKSITPFRVQEKIVFSPAHRLLR